ncbi:tRNA (adenosine(37)-N6)-dimethylallyltransferase MiaA [Deinococcus sp. AJ005]|uniref:tRNA (adenosine(37)-N6)-dimethylallyltransferase MiaA n=1 Tax=Deinococcus sp. AJ005 TaxID=2652443 RepID=UPI00125CD32F|nr:tRNA (adenosine(37)-N6)-dimethylallyltransferase MiaA [Deinococcus sp. AJ005]QFP77430.1 tRNA (adenosine(37)-N6)-dimethylallyltransferase MiaA [Deinococcus sp. AJ005]
MTRLLTPIPLLTAPTAAGKSALALELAQEFGLEVVSADAFTVYRGLDIGTAKPTPAEREAVAHHLLDVADVSENYDVARYVQEAEAAIAGVLERGRVPLVVGGTTFYLTALLRGLPLTPPADPGVRAAVEAELAQRGLDALLADITASDPAEARRMERNPRRIVRATEVFRRTGQYPGSFGNRPPRFGYAVTAFTRPGPELEARMAARVGAMFAAGWAEEAAWLASQLDPETLPRPTAWQALGYREAWAVATGHLGQSEATARAVLASRQYAKRQLTAMRSQLGAQVLTPQDAIKQVREHLGAAHKASVN